MSLQTAILVIRYGWWAYEWLYKPIMYTNTDIFQFYPSRVLKKSETHRYDDLLESEVKPTILVEDHFSDRKPALRRRHSI